MKERIQSMKTNPKSLILCASLFVSAFSLAFGQGTLIVQHSGATDPTTEGFTLSLLVGGSVGPVTNDLGMNAWATVLPQKGFIGYTYSLTPLQQSETVGSDWILSATLRDLQSIPLPNTFIAWIGADSYVQEIGSEINGDPYVDGSRSNPVFVLNGGGGGYHNYQWVYSAATTEVALWVDGVDQIPDFFQIPATGISQIEFGEGQGGYSSDNWSSVSLEIVPEPSAMSLLFLGGGFLIIYVRNRNKCSRRQSHSSYEITP
jgi:hypothetical protein